MKRNTLTSIALIVIILMMGGCGNNVWDELPQKIVFFISEYFPEGEIESYKTSDDGSVVKIKNGATLSFNSDYQWVDVNGNGATLPQQFLFDKLPTNLYDYLESIEAVGGVYRVRHYANIYKVNLLDSELEYDELTATISYPSHTSTSELLF